MQTRSQAQVSWRDSSPVAAHEQPLGPVGSHRARLRLSLCRRELDGPGSDRNQIRSRDHIYERRRKPAPRLEKQTVAETKSLSKQRSSISRFSGSTNLKAKAPKPKPSRDPLDHARWYLDCLVDVFKMKPYTEDELKKLFTLWKENLRPLDIRWEGYEIKHNNRDEEIELPIEKCVKWLYASIFSYITHQEAPKSPFIECKGVRHQLTHYLGVGRVKGFVKRILHKARQGFLRPGAPRLKSLSIAATFANLKKGSPIVSDDLVAATTCEHKTALTETTTGRPPGKHLERPINREIKNVVQEVFARSKFPSYSSRSICPSISGHWDSPKSGGGAAAALFSLASQMGPMGREVIIFEDVLFMYYVPGAPLLIVRQSPKIDWILLMKKPKVMPYFLREPLKVRPITAGPSANYYACMPLQKYLWSVVKRHPSFLIDRSISVDTLRELEIKTYNITIDGEPIWISGDYKASTDNLKMWISLRILRYIAKYTGIPGWLRRLAAQCLVGHDIIYPFGPNEYLNPMFLKEQGKHYYPQTNGQLMGSPISFPILCLANAVLTKLSYSMDWDEEYDCDLADLPILINGDDVLLYGDKQTYSNWNYWTSAGGLETSIGKTYASPWFVQMNSTNYVWEETTREQKVDYYRQFPKDQWEDNLAFRRWRRVPYVNFSLCNQYTAKGAERRHWTSLGELSVQFCAPQEGEEVPFLRGRSMFSLFRKRASALFSEVPKEISWFLHPALGGLGCYYNEPVSMSKLQQRLASYLYSLEEKPSFASTAIKPYWMTTAQSLLKPLQTELEVDDIYLPEEDKRAEEMKQASPFIPYSFFTSDGDDMSLPFDLKLIKGKEKKVWKKPTYDTSKWYKHLRLSDDYFSTGGNMVAEQELWDYIHYKKVAKQSVLEEYTRAFKNWFRLLLKAIELPAELGFKAGSFESELTCYQENDSVIVTGVEARLGKMVGLAPTLRGESSPLKTMAGVASIPQRPLTIGKASPRYYNIGASDSEVIVEELIDYYKQLGLKETSYLLSVAESYKTVLPESLSFGVDKNHPFSTIGEAESDPEPEEKLAFASDPMKYVDPCCDTKGKEKV